MSRSTPSLLALLGLVAVAGYQNRGRISEMLSDAQKKAALPGDGAVPGSGGFLTEIGQLFQGGTSSSPVSTALNDLVARFRETGRGQTADSWVAEGANVPLDVRDLEAALGTETLDALSHKTGMTREELLLRLNVDLPKVVDRLTPQGRLPVAGEGASLA